ncbi:MAG TPA: branched-chain amino acid ABC transporter permease [Planctomycetota bacterium]|jgi:branched-chain amino acid transport system permease protein
MTLDVFAQYLITGVCVGCIYAIVAIGFNIIYNTTGIINFAQGEFVMCGGMTALAFYQWLPLPLAVVAAVVVTMLLGAAIEFLFIRWLSRPTVLRTIIITIGISILIREAAWHIWGNQVRALPPFSGDETSSLVILGAHVTPQKIWVLATCAALVAALGFFFSYSLLGKMMRACAANRNAAALCGINTRNLVTFAFMLSAGLGALAGCVISPVTQTTYDIGPGLAVKGFTVAILGGMGSSGAAVAAGILLGVVEAFCTHYMPLAFKDALALGLLLLILFVRPHGLFGNRALAQLKEC